MESFELASSVKDTNLFFPIVRIPDNSTNVPSIKVYLQLELNILRIASASNNPHSFSTAIKPIVTNMSRQGFALKIKIVFLKNFGKHQGDFNVCKRKHRQVDLAS